MRSATLADRRDAMGHGPTVRDLLVLWQHPVTHAIWPIGRFEFNGHEYTFRYTRAAGEIVDFRPLSGLDNLRETYSGSTLPAVFGQRVMDASRPDFHEYLTTLGLDPAHATPWEQIVSSRGTRMGDTLQFMQVPGVFAGRARARFLVNGIRRIPGVTRSIAGRTSYVPSHTHEAALAGLAPGETVFAEHQDDNPDDVNAMLVTTDGMPLGFVPRILAAGVRELGADQRVALSVVRVGPPGTPPHLRLVLDLDVPAPVGFAFDRTGQWAPLTPRRAAGPK